LQTGTYLFCAPVSATDFVIDSYVKWLISYSRDVPIHLRAEDYADFRKEGSTNDDRILNFAENSVKTLTLYHWCVA
jgi:hypothetical protein